MLRETGLSEGLNLMRREPLHILARGGAFGGQIGGAVSITWGSAGGGHIANGMLSGQG